MQDRFDEKPLKAEVIDMDRAQKSRARPSSVYSERIGSSIHGGSDDPGYRYLFEDSEPPRRRRRSKTLKSLGKSVLSLALGIAGAWLVWSLPGFGPQEHQSQVLERLLLSEVRFAELESRLVQAQARVVELARTVEIQRELLDQGESVRRSMEARIETQDQKLIRIADETRLHQSRMETLDRSQSTIAGMTRRNSESIENLDIKFDSGLTKVRLEQRLQERRLGEYRLETARAQREGYAGISEIFEHELEAIRKGELQDMRVRVERLATHVWQEVGRLDGRIVRATFSENGIGPR